MKSIFFFIALALTIYLTPEVSEVREQYRNASDSQEKTKKLYNELSSVSENDAVILVAYKGATSTIMAKYAKRIKAKKAYFKEGRNLIEKAIVAAPENTELRYIRLSVQENAPKIVGYKKEIDEDKQFILDNYKSVTDAETKKFIKDFVTQSTSFSEAEKGLF